MSWQLLIGISVITLSVCTLLRRVLLHRYKSDPFAFTILWQALVGLVILFYALYKGFVMPDVGKYGLVMLVTVGLYAAANVFAALTLQKVEASVFPVLFATSAVWVVVASLVVFDDPMTLNQLLGVVLIGVSVVIVAERNGRWKLDRGTTLGLIMGMLFGLATVGWTYVGRNVDTQSWNALSFLGPALLVLLYKPGAVRQMKPLFSGGMLVRLLALGVIFSISAITAIEGFTRGNVNLAAALQQTAVVVTPLLAIVFLRERANLLRKGVAALVCFVAVVLIVS